MIFTIEANGAQRVQASPQRRVNHGFAGKRAFRSAAFVQVRFLLDQRGHQPEVQTIHGLQQLRMKSTSTQNMQYLNGKPGSQSQSNQSYLWC